MRIDSPLMNNAVATGSFTGSFIGVIEAESLSGAAYTSFSSSIASGISTNASDISALQTFSSSLESTFATDAELSSVSASLAGDISTNSSRLTTIESIEIFSGSIQVDHDQTTNFVSNEHIDHTSVTLTAGNGLTGGGDISTSRTFTVGAGDGITVNADDIQVDATVLRTTGNGVISGSSQVDHDQTTNFVSNEHIDHSSVSITAGAGLTGGGDLTSTRTLNIGAGTGVTVNADDIAIGQDVATSADVTFNSVAVTNDVTISGNLSVLGDATQLQVSALNVEDINITIASGAADSAAANGAGITIAGANESLTWDHGNSYFNFSDDLNVTGNITATGTIDGVDVAGLNSSFNTLDGKTLVSSSNQIDHDSTTNFVANEHIDHTSVTLTAGSGLTGGGDISSNRTFNVGAGDGITVNADDIAVDATVLRTTGDNVISSSAQVDHDQTTNFDANEHFTQAQITTVGTVTSGDVSAILPSGTVSGSVQVDHDSTTGFVSNEHIDHTSVTFTAGTGLTGGGDISSNRTFAVDFTDNTFKGNISGSFTNVSASIAADIASNLGAIESNDTDISALQTDSGSFSTRVTLLEDFSSSLDSTYATDSELSNVSSSLAASIAGNTSTISSIDTSVPAIIDNAGTPEFNTGITKAEVLSILNVEDGADVTDTANVTAAGALMDSEVDADIKTLSLPANTTISTFGASLIDDADATAGKTTLGLENVTNESKATMFTNAALTGIPTAPTATTATDSTQIATTAFVQDRIAEVIDTAPAALDTLNELAAAIGDDPNISSSLATTISTKLAKDQNLADLTNAATARTNLGVDAAGTDNSTDVTLAGSLDYITISGQQITRNAINVDTDLNVTPTGIGKAIFTGSNAAAIRSTIDVDQAGTDNSTDVTLAGSYDYITITGQTITRNQITNDDLAGSIANAKLSNSSITINGSSVSLGGTRTLVTDDIAEDGSPVNLWYTDARVKSKLNNDSVISGSDTQVRTFLNVENGADVTDTANVTAAGALMDTEVDADIKTLSLPANTTISTFGASLVDDANAAAAISTLGLDADIATLSLPASTTISAFGKTLVDDADASAARTTLGLGSIATLSSIDISTNTNLTQGTGITLTGDTLSTNDAQIVHDNLSGFVANEHINHTSVTLTAGSGLTGGGTIAASRTFNVGQGDGITVSADAVAVDSTVARKNIDNNFSTDQTFGNITVNGTGSFAYIQSTTGSAKIIGDNYIVLNNSTPTQRYAGIQVYDSGSVGVTASLEFDGQTNDWFYQYSDDGGASSEYGTVIFGPEYSTKGTATYPTNNKVQKGTGGHHIADSNITDTGTLITLGSNTDVTGTLDATNLAIGGTTLDQDIATLSVPASTTISAFGKTLVDDADAATARTTLGLGSIATLSSIDISSNTNLGVTDTSGQTGINMSLTGDNISGVVSGLTTSSDVQFDSLGIGTTAPGTTGVIRATSDIVAYYSSDERLKDNIKAIPNALEKVESLRGVEFDWNNKQEIYNGHDIGVIAQEVEAVLPEIVETRDNGYKAVKYEKLTAVLIQAVKELSARVKELENK